MKKSLIALAVLAVSGAAMAQSTVTLYGIADVWVGSIKSETAGVSTRTTEMVSGGVSTSRWGMKGSEDLGGGLKANFQFEQSVSVDTGVTGTGFDRAANVGFSGGFGAVKLGLAGTAFDDAQAGSVAVFDADLSPVNGFTTASGSKNAGAVFRSVRYTGKVGNQIHYQAPTMGGFSAALSYSLDEKTAYSATILTPMSVTALNVTYAGGPIAAQFAYQKEDRDTVSDDMTYTRLGASYNFGMATAKFQYGQVKNATGDGTPALAAGAKTTEWAIGADIPLSAALTLGVGYAKSDDNAAGGDQERDGYGLALAYSLSKRTTLYGGLKMMTYDNKVTADTDVTAYAVGVKHTF
ncbi:porin [Rhodoferax sp. 4810]|nr:porin [Rhodoferax jenense]